MTKSKEEEHDEPQPSPSQSSVESEALRKKSASIAHEKGPAHACCPALNPEKNSFLRNWDLATGTALIFVSLVSPYEVAFISTDHQGPEFLRNGADALFWLNRLIDSLFIVDMVLQFFIEFPVHSAWGTYYITDHRQIARHYLKSWFAIDFVSIMPFDILGFVMQSGSVRQLKILRVVRLLRLLKLARLVRGLRILKRWEVEVSISYRKLTMFGLVVTVCISAHWISCLLGIINGLQGDVCYGSEEDPADCTLTWFSPAAMEIVRNGEVVSAYRRYTIALYVAATVIVHPHVLPPKNEGERVPFIILIFLGGFIWTRVISRSTALITSMDRHTIHFQQTMDDLNGTTKEKRLPHQLRKRLRAFFMNTRDSSQRQTWVTLIGRMSPELKSEVLYQTSKDWIRRVKYLAGTSKWFLQDVTMHVKAHHYAQKETFGANLTLYILKVGMCNWSKGSGRMCIMRPGDVWGEEHLFLTHWELLRPNTSTTISFCEVLTLHREAFAQVCADFPEYKRQMRNAHKYYIVTRGLLVYAAKLKAAAKRELKGRTDSNLSMTSMSRSRESDDDEHGHSHMVRDRQAKRDIRRSLGSGDPSIKSAIAEIAEGRETGGESASELEKRLTARLTDLEGLSASMRNDFASRLDILQAQQATLESLMREGFARWDRFMKQNMQCEVRREIEYEEQKSSGSSFGWPLSPEKSNGHSPEQESSCCLAPLQEQSVIVRLQPGIEDAAHQGEVHQL